MLARSILLHALANFNIAETELLPPQQGIEVASLEGGSAIAYLCLLDQVASHPAGIDSYRLQHHFRL